MKTNYPVSIIDEIYDPIEGANSFMNIELRFGYYQLSVRDSEILKTTLKTWYGHDEFVVM